MYYKFFNQSGDILEPEYGTYSLPHVNIFFKRCSVNLFSTESIYFLEECYNSVELSPKPVLTSLDEIYQTELYRLLTLLNSSSVPLSLNDLNWNLLGEDFPYDYNRNREHWLEYSEYITETFDNIFYYEINSNGRQYLEDIDKKSADKYFEEDLRFTTHLIRPRLKESDTLYFKWRKRCEYINLFKVSETDVELFDKYRNVTEYKERLPIIEKLDVEYINDNNLYPFDSQFVDSDTFTTDQTLYNTNLTSLDNPKRVVNTDKYSKQPIKFNFCFSAPEDDVYDAELEIYIKHIEDDVISYEPLLLISFQAEAVGESERFVKMLENFGRNLDASHFDAIQGSDLEDANPDYIFINEKRKELLIEGPEIFDYVGSYKCLERGLKWLNAKDVKIREYFYNVKTWVESEHIDYKGYDSAFDFEYDFTIDTYKKNSVEEKFDSQVVNSADWKKTTRLGLIYYYNKALQQVDSKTDLPIIEMNEGFSPEELLIYFYNMKKTLEKVFLPHNARIINITLEGVYFAKLNLIEFKNDLPIKHIDFENLFYDIFLNSKIDIRTSFNKVAKYIFNTDIPKANKISDIYPYTVDELKDIEFELLYKTDIEEFRDAEELVEFIRTHFETADEFLDYCENFWDGCDSKSFGFFLLECKENELTWEQYGSTRWKELQAVDVNTSIYATATTNNDEKYSLVNNEWVKDENGQYSNNIINQYNLNRGLNDTNINYDENNHPYPEISYTWELTNISKNSKIEWTISRKGGTEVAKVAGTYEQFRKLLVPVYKYGEYDVRCRVTNVYNYPEIVVKPSFIVLQPPPFIVYGMCESEYNGSKKSTNDFLEDNEFSEEYLNYYNYLNQNFVSNQIEQYHLCSDINEDDKKIENIDWEVMIYAMTYEPNYDNLYLYPSDEFEYGVEYFVNNENLFGNKIVLNSVVNGLPNGKTFHTLYNKKVINKDRFEILEDCIRISIVQKDGLELLLKEGCSITLVSYENEKVDFYVTKTEINYITGVMYVYTNRHDEITLYNDINFRKSKIEPDFGHYNIRTWKEIEINYNKKIIEQSSLEIDEDTVIMLDGGLPSDYERLLKGGDVYIKINTLPDYDIVVPMSDVTFDNTFIKIDNCKFENITNCHLICFAKFDIGNAISHSNFNKLFPYHSQIKNKIYLWDWESVTPTNNSYFKFNGGKKILFNFKTHELNTNDFSTIEEYKTELNKLKLQKVLDLLNTNSKDVKFYFKGVEVE